jgi:hypothetical protein
VDSERNAHARRTKARRPVVRAPLPVAALLAGITCSPALRADLTAPRLLDRVCAGGACALSGSARATSGIAPGSTAIAIGPGAGSVRIPLGGFAAMTTRQAEWHVEVLLGGSGTVVATCNGAPCPGADADAGASRFAPDGSYVWTTVEQVRSTYCPYGSDGCSPFPAPLEAGATLELTTDDPNSTIAIADLRIEATSPNSDVGCE